jgi:hypothetical protein
MTPPTTNIPSITATTPNGTTRPIFPPSTSTIYTPGSTLSEVPVVKKTKPSKVLTDILNKARMKRVSRYRQTKPKGSKALAVQGDQVHEGGEEGDDGTSLSVNHGRGQVREGGKSSLPPALKLNMSDILITAEDSAVETSISMSMGVSEPRVKVWRSWGWEYKVKEN